MTAILQSPWGLAKYMVEQSILKMATLISILSPSATHGAVSARGPLPGPKTLLVLVPARQPSPPTLAWNINTA